MIFCNVCHDRNIRSERFNVIQLKTADLSHIQSLWIFCNLPRKRITDVSYEGAIKSCGLAYMKHERGSCCFSIATRDADDPAITLVPVCKFNLADYRNSFL